MEQKIYIHTKLPVEEKEKRQKREEGEKRKEKRQIGTLLTMAIFVNQLHLIVRQMSIMNNSSVKCKIMGVLFIS